MSSESQPRAWKPTKPQLERARGTTIPDVVAPGLRVLFVGINPSLYSAAVGHHFARPGNRFWPALCDGGFTPRRLSPFEDQQLVEFGCGLTNFIARATARADELSDDELRRGARRLQRLVARWRPRCVAFAGVTSYRAALGQRQAAMGRQATAFGSALAWVLPNPSGLNAHYQRPDFARLFRDLRQAIDASPVDSDAGH